MVAVSFIETGNTDFIVYQIAYA